MSASQLLAVVEVPREDRVRCQSVGCNHSVFRRIHVVRENSAIRVYGSECFKKLFVGLPIASATPHYTSSEGRQLTDEERQLLVENTERLIQQFEAQYQAELTRKAVLMAAAPISARPEKPAPAKAVTFTSPAARQAAESQAKEHVRSTYGVNPDLPGWRGLVLMEMKRILREDVG
jgi:hypothetical protein